MGQDGAGDIKKAPEVRIYGALPIFVLTFDKGFVDDDAGIAHQNINLAEGFNRLCDKPLRLLTLGYIRHHNRGFPSGLLYFCRHGLSLFLVRHPVYCNPGTITGKTMRDSLPDAPGAPRYDGDFAF
jgi:hypothetical protein